jgi:hypothetical protein
LKILKTLGSDSSKGKKKEEPVLNARKAIREITKGQGVTSLQGGTKKGKGKKR